MSGFSVLAFFQENRPEVSVPQAYGPYEVFFDRFLILMVAASFFFAVGVMVRRTWKWDWLGVSVALLLGVFAVVFCWTFVTTLRPDLTTVWSRWVTRSLILTVALNFDAALYFTPLDSRSLDPVLRRLELMSRRMEEGLTRLEALGGNPNHATEDQRPSPVEE